MQREYRCDANSGGCGRRWWYRDAKPHAHRCAACGVSLIATGRRTDASVIAALSDRAAKYQTYGTDTRTPMRTYITHLRTGLHRAIVDSGMAIDDLDETA